MKVLVVNAGSSSLKYQLFDTENGTVMAKGNCERIGIDAERLRLLIYQNRNDAILKQEC